MKPMHHVVIYLSRCPCCHSRYSRTKNRKMGKSAARQEYKRQDRKETF